MGGATGQGHVGERRDRSCALDQVQCVGRPSPSQRCTAERDIALSDAVIVIQVQKCGGVGVVAAPYVCQFYGADPSAVGDRAAGELLEHDDAVTGWTGWTRGAGLASR